MTVKMPWAFALVCATTLPFARPVVAFTWIFAWGKDTSSLSPKPPGSGEGGETGPVTWLMTAMP